MAKSAKFKGCVRAARYQVGEIEAEEGDRIKTMQRWRAVSESCMVGANAMFQAWLVWHVQNDTAAAITKMRADWVLYKESLKEAKEQKDPSLKLDKPDIVQPFPPACSKACYDAMVAAVQNLNGNVLTQLMQSEKQKFTSRPATHGSWSYWQQVLLCRERLPQFTHPLPIPIKRSAYDLLPPLNGSSTRDYTIVSRIDRIDGVDGNRGTSHKDEFALFARKKNIANYRAILGRIHSGEYRRMGASLNWDDRRKRWFCSVMYQIPKQTDSKLDPDKIATLRPAEDHPWELDLGGKSPYWLGGDGMHVTSVRRNLNMQRRGRQAGYRHAASANKGHGRERALQPLFRLSRAWKDFVKTANNNTTAKVVQVLVERGFGTVVYEQPSDGLQDSMFLNGKKEESKGRHSMGWDWYQVLTQLRHKCERHGISVVISKQKPEPLAKCDATQLVEKT